MIKQVAYLNNTDLEDLEAMVNAHLEDRWELLGPLVISHKLETTLCQCVLEGAETVCTFIQPMQRNTQKPQEVA